MREAVMFVYTGVSGLSIFSGPQTHLGKRFGVDFIHSLPSGSRSALRRNFWQPHFLEVAVFSQIREATKKAFFPVVYQSSNVFS